MKLTVDLERQSYDVIIKRGALKRANLLTNLTGKVLLLHDSGIPDAYVKTIKKQCGKPVLFQLPQGEACKSIDCWREICSCMLSEGFNQFDTVVGLGGGAVCDTAGFAAATYKQGIGYCLFPTSSVAQMDAAVGGETALNADGIKNALGIIHQPDIVVIDPDLLKTLTPRQMASGLALALKTGLLCSRELYDILESLPANYNNEDIERIIYLSLLNKKGLLERERSGSNEQILLNFGCLIGHGIETACGLGNLPYGECIALGMLPMIETRSLLRRTRAIMRRLGLPVSCRCNKETVLNAAMNDRSYHNSHFTTARVKHLGQGYVEAITYEEMRLLYIGDDNN